jgi:hypothetical protein
MPADQTSPQAAATERGERRQLTPEAERALAEAAARRAASDRNGTSAAKEVGGRNGPEPTRYGDWEVSGLASDF